MEPLNTQREMGYGQKREMVHEGDLSTCRSVGQNRWFNGENY